MKNSNTFRERNLGAWCLRWFWASAVLVCSVSTTEALHPNRLMSEYIRERWDAQRGFPGGPVYAISQTPDGYLWFGTEKGLVRFDGLNFRLFDQTNSSLPPGPVMDLMTDVEGNLWIRPQRPNLVRYRDGKFQDVISEVDKEFSGITAMCRGKNGEGLFAVRIGGIYAYTGGKFTEVVPSRSALVISVAQTEDGKIWMGTRDVGLLYTNEGTISFLRKELPDTKINSLLVLDRELWIGTDHGVVRWNGHEIDTAGLPDSLNDAQILALTKDRQSNVWIGTSKGLMRLNANGATSLEESGDASLAPVNAIFEDREGNLWIGSRGGTQRLRDSSFLTYSASRDLSAQETGTVYVDTEGRRWFAPSSGGLHWEKGQQVGDVKNDGLDRDVVYSLIGNKDELWIGRQRGGLTHLKFNGGNFTTETYTHAQGLVQNSIYSVHLSRDGSVWAGSLGDGVTRLKDGKFTTYTMADGLASNSISSIAEGTDGTMWFASARGLSSFSQGRWKIYGGVDGLPPGRMNCLFEDSNGALWIGTDNGIAIYRSGLIQIPGNVPNALSEPVMGIAGDRNGYLWVSTSNHVLRVSRDKLLAGGIDDGDIREFGIADGLRSVEGVKRDRTVIVDPSGLIWFSTYGGLSVVDPAQVENYSVPGLVHVEGVVSDGTALDLQAPVRVQGARRITFSYAGLSFSIPERIRYRYKLDGYDQNWSEPVVSREATYTNLVPNSYRFRVMATNSAGLWNGVESTIPVEVQPFFWQTWWFRFAGVLAIGLTMLFLYRLRLHQLTQRMDLRFEERLAERTRIAQDLHDTLLQGFLSASMQLHVAAEQIPTASPAKPLVGRVLELMRQIIEEGRTTLRGLRSTTGGSRDLAESFSGIQGELASGESIDYRVTVEGPSRPLHPVIRDEIYHIGREALVNAFRHSGAATIEVELEYGLKQLRVLVRDDGRGIDPQVLRSGREGHWGIPGMRERAEEIGARLRLWSRPRGGTEVELSIPGQIAYELQSSKRSRKWLPLVYPRRTQQDGRK